MSRWFIASSINPLKTVRSFFLAGLLSLAAAGFFAGTAHAQQAQAPARENIEMGIVAVNPSSDKEQAVTIKTYLPQEVTPEAIVDAAGLDIDFDAEQSLYYVYKNDVLLKPSETKTFNIELRDVWIIPQGRLDSLRAQAQSVISRLEGSPFYESARLLGDTIYRTLDTVAITQNDTTVSRKSHIGIYRNNLLIVNQIKEDIDRLEKQLAVASSLPKPDVLEESQLKTESPTESTSWMIIFIIMLFIGMLAGVFFFTWHAQAHATKDLIASARNEAFPGREGGSEEEKPKQ